MNQANEYVKNVEDNTSCCLQQRSHDVRVHVCVSVFIYMCVYVFVCVIMCVCLCVCVLSRRLYFMWFGFQLIGLSVVALYICVSID